MADPRDRVVWLPIYSLFINPFISSTLRPNSIPESQIQTLLDVRRYTFSVPAGKDGWYIGLETIVDGQPKRGGGSTVHAGQQITVLVRRLRDTQKIEYCLISERSVSRGVIDDPLAKAGITANRDEGVVHSGDWLYRGGRDTIQSVPDRGAEFEVRLVLEPPREA